MSARRQASPGPDHSFRMRGAVVTFRATAFGGPVRVEVIGLDVAAIEEASAKLGRAIAEAGFEVRHLAPAPQCQRLEVLGADASRVRAEFAPVARALEGGPA